MAGLTCKWNKAKTQCSRSDGRVCTINTTRWEGQKGYQARVWAGNLDESHRLRSLDAKLWRTKSAAQAWCSYAAKR